MNNVSPAPPPEEILAKLGPIVREKVIVNDVEYFLDRPSESDRLIDHPAVHTAFARDEYMPYWADLWPASRMLAKVIQRETWTQGTHAVELGCGLGLPGIVGLAKGLKVTFTDYDLCALRFAADNARLNGYTDFETLQLDWRHPPAGWQIPILFAADLVYEMRNIAPLVQFIKQCLHPEGVCYLTDQDRLPAQSLRDTLAREGVPYTAEVVRAGEPNGRRLKGTLYRIRKPR